MDLMGVIFNIWFKSLFHAFSDDYNCLYITGDSNHIMGRETMGNASGVLSFNFATSFSFTLIEQLVGNVWNTTKIGSVTLSMVINQTVLEVN